MQHIYRCNGLMCRLICLRIKNLWKVINEVFEMLKFRQFKKSGKGILGKPFFLSELQLYSIIFMSVLSDLMASVTAMTKVPVATSPSKM